MTVSISLVFGYAYYILSMNTVTLVASRLVPLCVYVLP